MNIHEIDKVKAILKQLGIFQLDMIAKLLLPKNLEKGLWQYNSTSFLLKELQNEVEELKAEIEKPACNNEDIIKECADIANFAMMIADRERLKMELDKQEVKAK